MAERAISEDFPGLEDDDYYAIQLNERRPRFLEGQETYFTYEDFRKPATTHHWPLQKRADSVLDVSVREEGERRRRPMPEIIEGREKLPIFKIKESLLKEVSEHSALIVVGDTGSGKTTQIPQYLYQDAKCERRIGIAMPCAPTAIDAAQSVAEELGCAVGEKVGYKIRFKDRTGPSTVIKYMSGSVLWSEINADPVLSGYSVIMIDHAHKRSFTMDILFGLIKKIVADTRPDLKLVIASATSEAESLVDYFSDCKICKIPRFGREFPVQVVFSDRPSGKDPLKEVVEKILEIDFREDIRGDFLLFTYGEDEVGLAIKYIREANAFRLPKIFGYSLFELPDPAPWGAKAIVTHSTSETLPPMNGIRYVVDLGFTTSNIFNPKLATNGPAVITPISKAAAERRAAQAGCMEQGKCYRLYSKKAYEEEMTPGDVPEIQRTNLSAMVLQMKASRINDILNFGFANPPPPRRVAAALWQLYCLGALDENGGLTETGKKMAGFPLDPPWSRAIIAGLDSGCGSEVLTVAAMVRSGCIFFKTRENQTESDHLRLLEAYKDWKANDYSSEWCDVNLVNYESMRRANILRDHLVAIMDKNELRNLNPVNGINNPIDKAIASGFLFNLARKDPSFSGYYRALISGYSRFQIHPKSSLFGEQPNWVIYTELVEADGNELMAGVTAVEPEWFIENAPRFVRRSYQSLVKQVFVDLGDMDGAKNVIEIGHKSKDTEEFYAQLNLKGFLVPYSRVASLLKEIHEVFPLEIKIELVEEDPEFLLEQRKHLCTENHHDDMSPKKQESLLKSAAKNHHALIEKYRSKLGDTEAIPVGESSKSTIELQSFITSKVKNDLVSALRENSAPLSSHALVVVSEAGSSGMSTQIPLYLAEAGFKDRGFIGCTQPSLQASRDALRVIRQLNTQTDLMIRYMEEFSLCNYSISKKSPNLSIFSAIMIDDTCERPMLMAVLFGLIKTILHNRRDDHFRLVVASADRDEAKRLQEYFFGCKVFTALHHTTHFPVHMNYHPPPVDPLEFSLNLILIRRANQVPGHIVIFLSGQEEVDLAVRFLSDRAKNVIVLRACSSLISEIDPRVFARASTEAIKVVAATAAAEAPLTAVDRLACVIDLGLTEQHVIDPRQAMDAVEIVPISRASANRRASLAAHSELNGKCYRLYTKADLDEMRDLPEPEIQTSNLAAAVIRIIAFGIYPIQNFDFIDRPPQQHVDSALRQMYCLGALNQAGKLTKLGKCLAVLPLDPPWAKVLILGSVTRFRDETLTIVAMAQAGCRFLHPRQNQLAEAYQCRHKFYRAEGDHFSLLDVYKDWKANDCSSLWCQENFVDLQSLRRASDLRDQLAVILDEIRKSGAEFQKTKDMTIGEAITSGLFFHAARKDLKEGGYRTIVGNSLVYIHPHSVLFQQVAQPDWVVYNKLVKADRKEYMFGVTVIDPNWLIKLAPRFFKSE